jgi:hypothetical protein
VHDGGCAGVIFADALVRIDGVIAAANIATAAIIASVVFVFMLAFHIKKIYKNVPGK